MLRQNGTALASDSEKPPNVKPKRRPRWSRKRDWGGILARALCVMFALIGLVPLLLTTMTRLDSVQRWAADKTAKLLQDHIRVEASYRLHITPWPLSIALHDVRVAASDGGSPFLSARQIVARPRLFSLLNGDLDLGEVNIEEPHIRADAQNGQLVNLAYELPARKPRTTTSKLPLSGVSLTNAAIDLTVDSTRVLSQQLDADVSIEQNASALASSEALAFELKLRTGRSTVDRVHPRPGNPLQDAVDEDTICSLDLRARLSGSEVRIRRLALRGALDIDPGANSRPGCDQREGDWTHTTAIASLRIPLDPKTKRPRSIDGRAEIRLPVPLVHRFVDIGPTSGWLRLRADELHWREGEQLPRLEGHLSGESLGIDGKIVARTIDTSVEIANEAIELDKVTVRWGGGLARIAHVRVQPLAPKAPLAARSIRIDGVNLPDLMNDLDGHPNAYVGWDLDKVTFSSFAGTLSPLNLAGPMVANTRNFAIYDRPARAKGKRKRMGIDRGTITVPSSSITPPS